MVTNLPAHEPTVPSARMVRPVLRCVRDAQPVDCRADSQIGRVDHHASVHRNPPRFAVPLEWPNEYVALGLLPILHAAVTDKIVGGARRAMFGKITRSAYDGDLHRSHDPDGDHICRSAVPRTDPI